MKPKFFTIAVLVFLTIQVTSILAQHSSGENKSGENKSGENKSGENKSGENKSGENKSDENKSGENNSGETTSSENLIGETTSSENLIGETTSSENLSGETTSSENLIGETTSSENLSGETTSKESCHCEDITSENPTSEVSDPSIWDTDNDDDDETCEGDQRRCCEDENIDKVKDEGKRNWIKETIKNLNKDCSKNGRGRRAFKDSSEYVRGMCKSRSESDLKKDHKDRSRLWGNIKGLRKSFIRASADFNMTINYIVHCDGSDQGYSTTITLESSTENTIEATTNPSEDITTVESSIDNTIEATTNPSEDITTLESSIDNTIEATTNPSEDITTVESSIDNTIEGTTNPSGDYDEEREVPAPEVEECDCNKVNIVIREVIRRRFQYLIDYIQNMDLSDLDETNEVAANIYLSNIQLSCQIIILCVENINEITDFTDIQNFYILLTAQINFVSTQLTLCISVIYSEPSLIDNTTLSIQEYQEEVETGLEEKPAICEPDNADGISFVVSIMSVNIVQASQMMLRLMSSSVVQEEQKLSITIESSANASLEAVISECDSIEKVIIEDLELFCNEDSRAQSDSGPTLCDNQPGSQRNQREIDFKSSNEYLKTQCGIAVGELILNLRTSNAYFEYLFICFPIQCTAHEVIANMYTFDGGDSMTISEECTQCASDLIVETRLARIETTQISRECAEENINSDIEVDTIACLQPLKESFQICMDDLTAASSVTEEVLNAFMECWADANAGYSEGNCGDQFTANCVEAITSTNSCNEPKVEEGGKKVKEAKDKCDSCRSQNCAVVE